jgi:hypothetical protein
MEIQARNTRWVGHVDGIGDQENAYEIQLENVKETGFSKDLYE